MEFRIGFGALQPTFAKQLEAQGLKYDEKSMAYCEKLRESITYLYFADMIRDMEAEKARKKLFKMIEAHVKKKNKLKSPKPSTTTPSDDVAAGHGAC